MSDEYLDKEKLIMKKFSIALLLTFTATIMTGCKDFLDINVSPDSPVTVTSESVLPTLIFFMAQEEYDNAEYNAYLSQCLTTASKSQSSTYSYKVGWGGFMDMNRHPQWRRHYYEIGVNSQYMIKDARDKQMYNYILIAKTINLWSLLLTTDEFGEIAMTQAYVERTPNYDNQQIIYDSIGRGIDDLLTLYNRDDWMNAGTNGKITLAIDRMFGGDLECWRAFTKALKVRYLMRNLPNMNNTPDMCQKIITAVDDALSDPGWKKMTAQYGGGPVYKFGEPFKGTESRCMWGPSQPKLNVGWPQARDNQLDAAIPGALLGQIMCFYTKNLAFTEIRATQFNPKKKKGITSYALDPRAERMMEPRSDDKKVMALRSIPNNKGMDVEKGTDYKITYYPDLFCTTNKTNPYTRDDGYITIITTEELLFDKAEAQYWAGNVSGARATTIEGIEASFSRYGVREELSKTDHEEELINAFYMIRVPAVADGFNISHIMQQKYVALYLQSEQWSDVRRYNYSSSANGIAYKDMTTGSPIYVYEVSPLYDQKGTNISEKSFLYDQKYDLRRPFNIYSPHWETAADGGTNFSLSANAWVNRLQPDPETEDKYNRENLERLGAYKNPNWLRKRMIWQMPTCDGGALVQKGDGEWMMNYGSNN